MRNLNRNFAGSNHQVDRAVAKGELAALRRPVVARHIAKLAPLCMSHAAVELDDHAEGSVRDVAPSRRTANIWASRLSLADWQIVSTFNIAGVAPFER